MNHEDLKNSSDSSKKSCSSSSLLSIHERNKSSVIDEDVSSYLLEVNNDSSSQDSDFDDSNFDINSYHFDFDCNYID